MAIQKTKPTLGVGTAPVEATLTGISAIYYGEHEKEEAGKLKAYVFEFAEYKDMRMYYSHKYPVYNDQLGYLVEQLAGTDVEFDDEKMVEVLKDYIGTTIYVCKRPSKDYEPGNLCFNKDYTPPTN